MARAATAGSAAGLRAPARIPLRPQANLPDNLAP